MAELKNTIVNGILNVNGDMVASKIVRRGGTDNQILMADGSVSLLSNIMTIINAGLNLKGTLGTEGTIDALPQAKVDILGDAYKVITGDTYDIPDSSGKKAKVGDLFVCYTPDNTNYIWMHIPSGDDIEDTWRPINLEGTQILTNGNTTSELNFIAGDNISITNSDGSLTFEATDTTYGAEKGITLSADKKFGHINSITKVTNEGLYKIAYDDYGHITSTKSFTLPVVNDYTLTMSTSGTGISGSATFTANSAENKTFTVTLNSNAEGNRTQGQVVIAKDTGLVAMDKVAISYNTSTKAIWQYNNTDDCIELIW